MGFKFNELVTEALSVERELRALTPDRPSLQVFHCRVLGEGRRLISGSRGEKGALGGGTQLGPSGSAAYIRHLTREIASGRLREPPAKERIGRMYWNQKDQAVFELGGQAEKLFLLWVIAAELACQQNADVFGTVEDFAAHKARIAELGGEAQGAVRGNSRPRGRMGICMWGGLQAMGPRS